MTYGFRVVYSTPGVLESKGFGRVAHLPFIMDDRPGYHRLANQFLIDRGLGIWEPKQRGKEESALPPSSVTMKDYAHWLANFLEWCHVRAKDPLKANYKIDLIQHYQVEMQTGIWSRDNVGLKPRTINVRVSIAAEFLTWAADKGLREPFHIPKIIKTYSSYSPSIFNGRETKSVETRKGKVREEKRRLGLPQEVEIFDWLQRLNLRCTTEALIAETILETAIRRAEAAAWRVDTLPIDPREWRIVNPEKPIEHQAVLIDLRFNTKGPEYGRDHGDKIGPHGIIRIPMPLAQKLHVYRERVRPKALVLATRKAKSRSEAERIRHDAVHLFLNPRNGNRYTGDNIYDFWRSVDRPRGWSPHLARDFWACSVLWKHIQQYWSIVDRALNMKVDESVFKILQLQAETCIQLTIQPQLRHVSQETTIVYLQWLSDRLGINMNFHQNWVEQLSQDDLEDGI
ncbi:hypothetical protein [Pseudoduganella sp. UC29_71]|uniref:hypothetical protein n=1 Tax=Pseudoduganella sp. UC29_71 TaxID=3350174 RepID=UPI00366FDCA8